MPRIIVFGKSKRRTRKVAHIVRAFRDLGNETLWLNPARIKRFLGQGTDAYILWKIRRFKPEIIFFLSMDIPLPVLTQVAGTGIKTVQFYVDSWRLEDMDRVARWGALADFFLVTASGLHDRYRAAGIRNPIFFTDACDRYDHKKRHALLPIWKSDVAFVGAARKDEPRVALVERIGQTCSLKIYGKEWHRVGLKPTLKEVGPRGFGLICSGAKIVLGADATSAIEGHWSNRLWLVLGCGGFLLTNYVPGMEKLFENRKHLVWYRDEEECLSLVREYLDKPQERGMIADAGYRYVHEHHTFHHFVDRVLRLCRS